MKENVLIQIQTRQRADGEELDPIVLETPGIFGVLNHKYYIKYKESELTGFPDTTTTVKIWPGHTEVSRRGKFNMKLLYEKGKRNLCLYPTPYGEIGAAIYTSDVSYQFSSSGEGVLTVCYTLDADNENFIENTLQIQVTPMADPEAE